MRFAKQNPFQSYEAPSHKQFSRALLDHADKSTQHILAIAKKFGAIISSDGPVMDEATQSFCHPWIEQLNRNAFSWHIFCLILIEKIIDLRK